MVFEASSVLLVAVTTAVSGLINWLAWTSLRGTERSVRGVLRSTQQARWR